MNTEDNKVKTRNLSIAEYFDVLQDEYMVAEFRKKIYFSPKDKSFYNRVMEHKREKIENISNRNNLDSIFNSELKRKEVQDKLFDHLGRPKFKLSDKDITNYYNPGNEFSYEGKAWILDQICENGHLILYNRTEKRFQEVKKSEVCRIL